MRNSIVRSILGLQPSITTRLTSAAAVLGLTTRHSKWFNSTAHIIEPLTPPELAIHAHPKASRMPKSTSSPSSASLTPPPSSATPTSPPPANTAAGPIKADSSVGALLPLLAAQPSHYIALHIHGRPYLVTPGDSIRLPFKMPGVVPGDVLRLDRASVIGSRDFTLKGAPWVNDAFFECRAVVLGTESEPMRLKIKKKQRCRRTKTVRSKHKYTVLRISELKIITPDMQS